jgi:NAD(P)-dependent dehydrogenase (short-subunit alcohol dehydrogenase family)
MNMRDKTVLVTGATNGIGKAAALELARMGARVIVVGRNRAKTEATVHEIKAHSQNQLVDMLLADLSSMTEVRRLANEFNCKYERLDVLVNNAGGVFSSRQETVDGYELTFALNHLAPFLLTNLLLDTIKVSAAARIINVASVVHTRGRINFDDLQSKRSYGLGGFAAYAASKLANVLFTYELARRLEGTGVTVNALAPGNVASGFGHNNQGVMDLVFRVIHRFAKTPEQGAETIIYLASSPAVEGVSGKYFDECQAVSSSPASYDEVIARRLWNESARLVTISCSQDSKNSSPITHHAVSA